MKVLWLSNFMLPVVAQHLGLEATNKEGWLSGLASVILERQKNNEVELAVAFPVSEEMDGYHEIIDVEGSSLECFGFYENMSQPEHYDIELEQKMRRITQEFQPDVIHCYGTEYPHTLAMCKAYPDKSRILISIQGLCGVYANTYFANLPERVVSSATLRDRLRKDTLVMQKEKYVARGVLEKEAVKLAGNVTGRTAWDKHYTAEWNPNAVYYHMNETLRPCFYEGIWEEEKCEKHSVFLSQGNYPIKGLHYMLLALPEIKKEYPGVKVYVAGDSIAEVHTFKDWLKISAYGRYLRHLIKKERLEDNIEFVGRLDAAAMKEQYLKSSMFVCCSTIENSPNSLGEAMILGVPCVTAAVGGIASIFRAKEDGIVYEGYRSTKNSFDNTCNLPETEEECLKINAKRLSDAVIEMWKDTDKMHFYSRNARAHAKITHDREANYRRMTEIYAKIIRA